MMHGVRAGLPLGALGIVGLLALGASTGCSRHKPFVPFEVGGTVAAPGPEDAAASAANAAQGIPVVDAGHLEVPTSTVTLPEGPSFQAPEGRILTDVASHRGAHGGTLLAVARDTLGEHPDVLLAYAYDTKHAGAPVILAEGPRTAGDERCVQAVQLRTSGKSSVVAQWRVHCPADIAAEPASVLVVAEHGLHPSVRLRVVFRDPVLDLPLELDADARDADDDGQDDLALRVGVEAHAPYTRGSKGVTFQWLARTAGASPVAGSLETSWQALEREVVARAADRSPAAYDVVAAARTVVDAVCGTTATVRVESGARLVPCDRASRLAALETAEQKGLVERGDAFLWAAFLAAAPAESVEVPFVRKALLAAARERPLRDVRREGQQDQEDAGAEGGEAGPRMTVDSGAAVAEALLRVRAVEDRCTGSYSARVEARGGRSFDATLPLRSGRRRGEGSGCTLEVLPEAEYRTVAELPRGVVILLRGRLFAVELPAHTEGADGAVSAEIPAARAVFPAAEGLASLFSTTPVVLRVGSEIFALRRTVDRVVLPPDADPSLTELWPPTACRATELPGALRCVHPNGAFFAALPAPPRGTKGDNKGKVHGR